MKRFALNVAALAAASMFASGPSLAQWTTPDLQSFMLGMWNAQADCASLDMTTYRADGTFEAREGRFRYELLADNRIAIMAGGKRIEGVVTIIDENTMQILVDRQGLMGYRCAGPNRPA